MGNSIKKWVLFIVFLAGLLQDFPLLFNVPVTSHSSIENGKKPESGDRGLETEVMLKDGVQMYKGANYKGSLYHSDSRQYSPDNYSVTGVLYNKHYITALAKQPPGYGQLFLQMLF